MILSSASISGYSVGHFSEAIEEKPVRQFHDVRFVAAGDFLAAFAPRILESKSRNARRSFLGDDLQTLNHARNHHVFQSRVQTFRVLANDDQIEFRIAAGNIWQARESAAGWHTRSSALRKPTLTEVKPLPIGVVTGPLSATLLRRIESSSVLRQRFAKFLQRLRARVVSLPFNLDARSFDDAHYVGGDFGADAVAGNQCDTMFHN